MRWLLPKDFVDAQTFHLAPTGGRTWPARTCVCECECGHMSLGHFFGAVWLRWWSRRGSRPWKWDAWKAHRRHAERVHGTDYRTQMTVYREPDFRLRMIQGQGSPSWMQSDETVSFVPIGEKGYVEMRRSCGCRGVYDPNRDLVKETLMCCATHWQGPSEVALPRKRPEAKEV